MTEEERWVLEEKYGGNAAAPGFAADRDRLARGEPVAYVIGSEPFLGLSIRLDSRPLIPRPETEWWTEELLATLAGFPAGKFSVALRAARPSLTAENLPAGPLGRERPRFLDLCAGSGAIGCAALARLPHARVYFGEADPAHEATIRKNIRENHLDESRADVRIGDLFEPFGGLTFDVIAANPPYIPDDRALPASVTGYEPALALRAGPDGLALIRRIARDARCHLAEHGVLWLECDSAYADDARQLFEAESLAAKVMNDQYGKPRVIVARPVR